jgi:uncharacterized protein YigA (DUF484 family)
MLQVRSDANMPRVLVDALQSSFDVPYVSLRLWGAAPEHASGWFTEDVTADVRMFANSLQAPYCGSNRDFEAVHWLQADKIESTVMIALRAPAPQAPSACWCSVRPTANGLQHGHRLPRAHRRHGQRRPGAPARRLAA